MCIYIYIYQSVRKARDLERLHLINGSNRTKRCNDAKLNFLKLTYLKQKTVFEPMTNCVYTKNCTYAKLNYLKLSETI